MNKLICTALIILISFLNIAEATADSNEKIVDVKRVRGGALVSIYEKLGKYSPPLARCQAPCKTKITTDKPFYIVLSPMRNKYGAIYRDMSDAVIDGNTYSFKIDLSTSENEELLYVRATLKNLIDQEKINACKTFSENDLNARPTPCYKMTPILPSRTKRSGWCKISFAVLPDGTVNDVEVRECSEDTFKVMSIENAKTYRYYPQFKDGKIKRSRVTTTIRYTLTNEKGKIIPSKREK